MTLAVAFALAAPLVAESQTPPVAATFRILWTAECEYTREATPQAGAVEGEGFATLIAAGAGYELRWSGPAGDSGVSTIDGSGAGYYRWPNPGCSSVTAESAAQFQTLGALADPAAFMFGAGWGSNGAMFAGSASGVRADIDGAIVAPQSGATVTGTTSVGMRADGVPAGVGVVFKVSVDGQTVGSVTSTNGAATYAWDTRTAGNGARTLGMTVTDKFGTPIAYGSAAVTVSNSTTTPPPTGGTGTLKVVFTSPKAGTTVGGTVAVNIWVEGAATGTNTFTLAVDGAAVNTQSCACAHVWPGWNSRAVGNGTHTLNATVRDSAGKTGTVSLTVTVQN
ncbi:MAG TPA: hypothetical protein VGT02_00345 [Methylomirabilota bacterium]|nr:hypothetical protein [Methylomirabilota bacterium]